MRLNPDCIRAVLFYIESNQNMKNGAINSLGSENVVNGLKSSFDEDDIRYSIKQLNDSYYLKSTVLKTPNYICFISDITPRGHDFINNVRNEVAWNKTMEVVEQNNSFSLEILGQIANAIASAFAQAAIKSITGI